jgi:formylglycine-generating enzyme required for sulfatase activity
MTPLCARLSILGVVGLAGGGLLFGLLGACSHEWDQYLPVEGAGADNPGGGHPGGGNTGGGEGGSIVVGTCPTGAGADSPSPPLIRVPTNVAIDAGTYRAMCIGQTEVTRGQYEDWRDAGPIPDNSTLIPACQNHANYDPGGTDWPPSGVRLDAPVAFVDWCDAMAFCVAHGQRLCGAIGGGPVAYNDFSDPKKDEWFNACTDRGRHAYPYGDTFDAAKCRDDHADASVDVSSMTGCTTSAGVHDLSGNVWEWEDSCNSANTDLDAGCRQRGGGFNNSSANDLRCAADGTFVRRQGSIAIGFRCCADPIIP